MKIVKNKYDQNVKDTSIRAFTDAFPKKTISRKITITEVELDLKN